MKQKENRKKTYVSPKAECVRTEQDLLQMTPFSGDHKDAPDDGQPLNARRIDSFGWEDEEDDGESSGRQHRQPRHPSRRRTYRFGCQVLLVQI